MKQKNLFVLMFLMILFVGEIFAGVTGKLKGKVVDKATGEPLPGAQIIITGLWLDEIEVDMATPLGAVADVNGNYYIINLEPGFYTVKAQMIGYKTVVKKKVKILQDLTTVLNFEMEETAIQGEEVVVEATKPIVQRDVTSSTRTVSGEEVDKMPVNSFVGFVANTGGAVETGGANGGIHIRGGRTDEVAYVVDGINTNDPVTGGRGITLDNNAIAEIMVITGGFDAEYGQAMSGVVNIVTKEGTRDRYSGTLELNTDALLNGSRKYDNGYNNYNFTLGGPLFFTKKASFFISGALTDSKKNADRAGVHIRHDDYHNYNGTYKITFNPFSSMKVILNGNYSKSWDHRYSHGRSYGNWLKDTPKYKYGNSQFNFKINHTLSPSTFYEFMVSYFNTYFKHSAQDGKHYNEWRTVTTDLEWVDYAYQNGWYDPKEQQWTRDMDSVWMEFYTNKGYIVKEQTEASYYDSTYGIWWADIIKMKDAYNNRWYDVGGWVFNDDSTGIFYREFDMDNYIKYLQYNQEGKEAPEEWAYIGDIDKMYTNYDPTGNFHFDFVPRWSDRSTTHYVVKFDLTSQINKSNQIKTGIYYRKSDLEYSDIQFLNTNPYFDSYNYKPENFAAYIQDKIEWEDMTLKPGVRFDYIDLKAPHPKNPENLEEGYVDTDPKMQISPRFGISFAMSDRAVMYASYGHFFQVPQYSEVYMNLNADITSGLPLVGNPDIKPEKTIAYEMGFRYALTNSIAAEISAYYKNVENLLGTRQVTTFFHNRLADYTVFKVDDFAKIKGLELKLNKRFSRGFSGEINYSFMNAKGTGSSAREFYYNYLNTGVELPKQEYPLEFDVTHSVRANLNYYIPKGTGPELFGGKIFDNLNINIQFTAQSGRPYTPTNKKGQPLEVGSKRLPATHWTDLKINKNINITSRVTLNLFVDIRNLFDIKNVRNVYSYTGKPDDDGYKPIKDPNNYAQYARYGYKSWLDFYNDDVRLWRMAVKSPWNYFNPRIIRFGATLYF